MKNFTTLTSKRQLPDNFIFHLHYRWTVLLLVICSFIITCRLYLGNSFTCNSTGERTLDIRKDLLETTCYEKKVFTLPDQIHHTDDNEYVSSDFFRIDGYRRYHSYYSWVNLLLLLHAFDFYLPHLLWKSYESGYLNKLTVTLESLGGNEAKRGAEICFLAKYILVTQGKHKLYTSMFNFCEVLNYIIALSHTIWLVYFFNVTGVPDFSKFHIETWEDFRLFYFPPTGRCIFLYDGLSSEGFSLKQALCQLPLNRLNMLMFLFIHAWYIILTVLGGCVLIFRIALLVPSFRVKVLKWHATLSETPILKALGCRLSYSDWFFLSRFQRVMTEIDFAQMLEKISIVSQCKAFENQGETENRLSLCDEIIKELDSSTATSPV